jgi:hypothetical protein
MKVIYTYTKIKGTPRYEHSNEFTINHAYDENTDKAICGFDFRNSYNTIGSEPWKESDYNKYITGKKCRKKLD